MPKAHLCTNCGVGVYVHNFPIETNDGTIVFYILLKMHLNLHRIYLLPNDQKREFTRIK